MSESWPASFSGLVIPLTFDGKYTLQPVNPKSEKGEVPPIVFDNNSKGRLVQIYPCKAHIEAPSNGYKYFFFTAGSIHSEQSAAWSGSGTLQLRALDRSKQPVGNTWSIPFAANGRDANNHGISIGNQVIDVPQSAEQIAFLEIMPLTISLRPN